MSYYFYLFIGLLFVILQTSVTDLFLVFNNCYDLLIPLILYLSMYRPFREGLLIVLLFGLLMDSLSGAPFGIYLTVYAWMLITIRFCLDYLRLSNTILLPFVVAAGVLFENLIFLITFFVITPISADIVNSRIQLAISQLLWAAVTGPIVLMAIRHAHMGSVQLMKDLFTPKTDYNT